PASDWARVWLARAVDPVPLLPGQKKPSHNNWPKIDFASDLAHYFPAGANVGIKVGAPYGIVDVDLDSIHAIRIWPEFAPATKLCWGRTRKPRSHGSYRCDPPAVTSKFEDTEENGGKTKKVTLLELRALKKNGEVGEQTMAPPSIHPSGEKVRFEPGGDGE